MVNLGYQEILYKKATPEGIRLLCSKGHLPHSIISCRWHRCDKWCSLWLRDDVASLEDALSQMGASSKMPFHFMQHGRSPSEWSLSLEHWQSNPTHEDKMHYYVQFRVTSWGRWRWPAPTSSCMDQLINCWHVPGWPWRMNYGSSGLAHGEAILFLDWWSLKEGLPLGDAWDVGFHFGGWGERLRWKWQWTTVQEGCWAIADTIVEKRTKTRGPGCPRGKMKTHWIPTAACNIEEWMWHLEEDASKVEVTNDKVSYCGIEQKNTCSQCVDRRRRWHRRQGTQWSLRDTSGGSPSSGGESSDWGNKWGSHQLTMIRGSRESNWAGRTGKGLRVKVNLPICKDERTKDVVIYHSW